MRLPGHVRDSAASPSLSPNRISSVATVSFSSTTGRLPIRAAGPACAGRSGSARGASGRRRSAAPALCRRRAGRTRRCTGRPAGPVRRSRRPAGWPGRGAAGAPAGPGRRRSRRRRPVLPGCRRHAGRQRGGQGRDPVLRDLASAVVSDEDPTLTTTRPATAMSGRSPAAMAAGPRPAGSRQVAGRVVRGLRDLELAPGVVPRGPWPPLPAGLPGPSRRPPRRRAADQHLGAGLGARLGQGLRDAEPGQAVGQVADRLVVAEVRLLDPAPRLLAATRNEFSPA